MLKKPSDYLIVMLLSAFLLGCSTPQLEEKTKVGLAVSKLKEAAHSDSFWVQVHAYEFLLKLGYHKWVDSAFHSLLKAHEEIPQERIGVWRIGVQKSFSKEDALPFFEKIKQAYLDTGSTDRLHAAESLAKLAYPFQTLPNELVKKGLQSGDRMRGYTLWGMSLPTEENPEVDYQVLLNALSPDDDLVSETVAYAFTKIDGVMPAEVWSKLREISGDERYSELTRQRLKLALFINSGTIELSRQEAEILENEIKKLLISQHKAIRYAACEAVAVKGKARYKSILEDIMEGRNVISIVGASQEDMQAVNLDCQSAAAYALLSLDKRKSAKFSLIDWLVIVAFLLLMIAIGFFYSKKSKNKDDYLLGGRSMNPIMVGLSLFATLLSTLSYLAYPGEMIKYGPMYFFGILGYPLAYLIIGRFIIPQFMKLNVTSAYEILEVKLGTQVRDLGTVFFLLLRFMWMSTIVYATVNTALIHIIGFDETYVPWVCLILALITVLYTTLGGIKAVVMTDAIQSAVLLGGALLTIVVISLEFGSFTNWLPNQWLPHWKEFVWKIDLNQRFTLGNILIMAVIWKVCTSGSDQMAIQRYLSTRDVKAAKKTLSVSLWSSAIVQVVLAILGLAVASYFLKHPQSLEFGNTVYQNADSLFPRFILIGLPVGVSGLVVAGLMAAAMSSLSSGLNSSSSVLLEDIFDRHFPQLLKFEDPLKKVRFISIALGLVVTVCSMFVGYIEGNLLDIIMKLVNLFVAPLFVLFFMALFVPKATNRGTFLGGLFSLFIAILIAFFELFNLSVLTIMPVSLVAGIVMSWILSLLDYKQEG